jgi:hypothetical protein
MAAWSEKELITTTHKRIRRHERERKVGESCSERGGSDVFKL